MNVDRRYNRADTELLTACARPTLMQEAWQRLYDMTSDPQLLMTQADFTWHYYSDRVWPGVGISVFGDEPLRNDEIPAKLRLLRATIREGQAAKATAVLALEEASAYATDRRRDSLEIMFSLVCEMAGFDTHSLGAQAAGIASPEPTA